jgi:hypothetical protein
MITKQLLQERFEYKDGHLIYKIKSGSRGVIGSIAGYTDLHGYIVIAINGKKYKAHRLIYIYHNGEIPANMEIDHINNTGNDNRIQNLRPATRAQNMHNSRKRKNNTSGYKGVSYDDSVNKWRARITIDGEEKLLGYFTARELASEAYKSAADKLHGEFAKY